jgi:hypothetical protein
MTGTTPTTHSPTDPAHCTHPRRTRENHWGWFSTETICLTCYQAFDPSEEAELRRGRPISGPRLANQYTSPRGAT